MWKIYFISLLTLAHVVIAQSESKVVQLEQGPVRGYKDAQGDLYSFLNIPYATVPTGTNKFKGPLPPPVWTEPHDASDINIACYQQAVPWFDAPRYEMKEDCLVASVYVPDTPETDLPVMVNIHGGAFLIGFGFYETFNSLVKTKKVIVVTFNYRLGVQGFLCLGTEHVPGNAGMKDQVALLRWVNRNIARFGGNPDDVTISGCSAGGMSVDHLTYSPMAVGLFKKAISDSGAVFGAGSTQLDPVENAKIYAQQLNFTNVDNLNALEEFYKNASLELLISESYFVWAKSIRNVMMFAPCVERQLGGEVFLADAPWNLLQNSAYTRVPTLYGFAEMEGLFRVPFFNIIKEVMNTNFSVVIPSDLGFESEIQKEEVASKVKEFYFENNEVGEDNILAFVDYFTDVMFAYPMLKASNLKVARGDTFYLYEYSFVDENTPFVPHTNVRGADHCAQTEAVSDDAHPVTNHTEQYEAIREHMREYWLNFITTGNPRPEGSSLPSWPAVTGVNSPYMALNTTLGVEQGSLLGARVRFWDSIYDQYYRPPEPPTVPSVPGSASTIPLSFELISALFIIRLLF